MAEATARDVYSHPDYRAFVASMRDDPEDDVIRLACADFLDEHAEAERAEFVRVQCELARLDPFDGWECDVCGARPSVSPEDFGKVEHGDGCYTQSEDGGGSEFVDVSPGYTAMVARERELLAAGGAATLAKNKYQWLGQALCEATVFGEASPEVTAAGLTWRRGFVEAITCSAGDWLAHAAEILALHPVVRVTLTTYPRDETGRFVNIAALRAKFEGVEIDIPDFTDRALFDLPPAALPPLAGSP